MEDGVLDGVNLIKKKDDNLFCLSLRDNHRVK